MNTIMVAFDSNATQPIGLENFDKLPVRDSAKPCHASVWLFKLYPASFRICSRVPILFASSKNSRTASLRFRRALASLPPQEETSNSRA